MKHVGLCAASLALAAAPAQIGATAASPAASSSVVLKANLTGPYLHTTAKGTGTATITFTSTKACWMFSYRGIDTPNISGIHVAPPPPAGFHKWSVFPFTATTSTAPGCEALGRWGGPVGRAWAKKIVANPSRFYVIIGTNRYPNGAIGGMLHRA